jgi:pyruvate dehydrogenase E2 component (dihydrolipoamide acetyltransferase)
MSMIEIRVPDIGDYKDVPIIELHVTPGATLAAEDPVVTLESDKATLEIPTDRAGTVHEVKVKVGDRVSQGDLLLVLNSGAAAAPQAAPIAVAAPASVAPTPAPAPTTNPRPTVTPNWW